MKFTRLHIHKYAYNFLYITADLDEIEKWKQETIQLSNFDDIIIKENQNEVEEMEEDGALESVNSRYFMYPQTKYLP